MKKMYENQSQIKARITVCETPNTFPDMIGRN